MSVRFPICNVFSQYPFVLNAMDNRYGTPRLFNFSLRWPIEPIFSDHIAGASVATDMNSDQSNPACLMHFSNKIYPAVSFPFKPNNY